MHPQLAELAPMAVELPGVIEGAQLLEQLLPLDSLLALIGDIAFDVPSLEGLVIQSAEVQRDGSRVATHVLVELD